MSASLADVMRAKLKQRYALGFAHPSFDCSIEEDLARAARQHVAKEITTRMDAVEAEGLDSPELMWWWRGMDDATRIAGGTS